MKWRTVDVDVDLGACRRLFGERTERAPNVFADRHANLHATNHEQLEGVGVVAGREVTLFVEHGGVGQQTLVIDPNDLAANTHRRSVVEISVLVDEPDDGDALARRGSKGFKRHAVVGDEPRLHHEILRRISGDRQFGERNDVASGLLGLAVGLNQLREVAVEITDRWVELGKGDTQNRHALQDSRPKCPAQ